MGEVSRINPSMQSLMATADILRNTPLPFTLDASHSQIPALLAMVTYFQGV